METIRLTIHTVPRTKKNSQRIVKCGSRFRLLPSAQYVDFENKIIEYVRDLGVCIEQPVNVKAVFYMPTRRKVDLTNLLEAIDDALVKGGILSDDNCGVVVSHDFSRVKYDKQDPRIEVEISDAFDADPNFIKGSGIYEHLYDK